jgi:O-acetyl-ADP-ribose deacetylase (regulator of RNase III)
MVKIVTGNLLEANVEALVNTVNTAGVMGKGLALQFKKAFPENNRAYEAACKAEEVRIGKMFVFDAGGIVLPRYIINFPTKRHWRSASKLEYIEAGLKDLLHVVSDRQIRSIAIPPLGAGLGGLDWNKVRPLIERAFAALHGVETLVFEPKGAPPPSEMRNATLRPKMTPGQSAVIVLMNRYLVPTYDYLLSLLEVQKLAYFLQEVGQPLRLTFTKENYGPYADALRHVLHRIEGHFVEGFGDGKNSPETPLRLLPGASDEAEAFLAADRATQDRLARVADLIEGYETPFGMELLSTVHWVARSDAEAARSPDEAVRAVHAWSSRKAATMKPEQIRTAWRHLQKHGWLAGDPGPSQPS